MAKSISNSISNSQSNVNFPARVPLTSIEAFHLYSSTESCPNVVTSRHRFHGSLDEAHARAAWQHCVARQKFAFWKFDADRARPGWRTDAALRTPEPQLAEASFHWIDAAEQSESESASESASELTLELPGFNTGGNASLDLNQSAFGVWCIVSPKETLIIFAVHHALLDGPAGIVFIRDWFTSYHNLCLQRPIDQGLGKLDWLRWKKRNQLGLLSADYLKRLPFQWIAFFGAAKFVLRKFRTVRADSAAKLSLGRSPGIVGRWIDVATVERLNDHAKRVGVSTNSLLMTMAFRALNEVTRPDQQKWLRLVLPINIREYADRRLPAANRASLVQVDRTAEQVADLSGGAWSIDREVKIIIGCKLDRVFLIAIRMLSVSHWLLKRSAIKAISRGTAVFTNLGEPFRKSRACDFSQVGEMQLIDYDMCGPVRRGTPINFTWQLHRDASHETRSSNDAESNDAESNDAETNDDKPRQSKSLRGRLSVHFDRAEIAPETAAEILDAYCKQFDSLA